MTKNKRIEEIRAREQAATAGKWEYTAGESEEFTSYFTDPHNGMVREIPFITVGEQSAESMGLDKPFYYVEVSEADAEFIAHSRADIPFLLGEVERLTFDNATILKE